MALGGARRDGAGCGRQAAPAAPPPPACLAIANVLGTGVQLNGDSLDPSHGLVAVAAARIVSGCRVVVIAKLD
jgi:hypothetical protein